MRLPTFILKFLADLCKEGMPSPQWVVYALKRAGVVLRLILPELLPFLLERFGHQWAATFARCIFAAI